MNSDKNKTARNPRVTLPPNNSPGTSGSLNIPLNGTRRRPPHARRRRRDPNCLGAAIAISGALIAFGLVALVIGFIMAPPIFQSLEPRYQQRIINKFPPATYWMKPLPYKELPTLSGASDSNAAQQLLFSTSTPTPTLQTGDTETPPAAPPTTDSGIPVGLASTEVPTMLPTYSAPDAPSGPTWTPEMIATEVPIPPYAKLDHIRYEAQGWNNCGPTTMTMALSYYGWTNNEEVAARWMKPHPEDKNVSPWQMVRFVNDNTDVKALYRIGGTTRLLKHLLAAGFPVVIEQGLELTGEAWMGHYLLLIGYDESQQYFIAFDSYLGSNNGQGMPHPYSVLDDNWRDFNRVFIVIYEPGREMDLRQALGDYVDPAYGAAVALETARAEAAQNGGDKWAWFNMGSSFVALGNYENAAIAYDKAFQLGLPWRMLWYQFGPYEAYYHTGRYNDVMTLAETTRSITPYVEETYYWQGMVYAAEGDSRDAVKKFDEALSYNKNFFPAQDAKAQVEAGTFQVAATTP